VEPARAVGLDSTLFSGSQALYDLESLGGADPLDVRTYRELIDASGIFRSMVWFTMVTPPDLARLAPLLDMLNVRFVFARPDRVPAGSIELPVAEQDRLKIVERQTAWPRAFFVDSLTVYADPKGLLEQVAAAGRPLAAVQTGAPDASAALHGMRVINAGDPSWTVVKAESYRLTTNTTSFRVRSPGPGVAVLMESHLPRDFRATVNGQSVAYFRVNHAFKGLRIPAAGQWDVTFEYRPYSWELSVALTGFGIIVLAGAVFSRLRAKGSL
jgi:hypothetical protein